MEQDDLYMIIPSRQMIMIWYDYYMTMSSRKTSDAVLLLIISFCAVKFMIIY